MLVNCFALDASKCTRSGLHGGCFSHLLGGLPHLPANRGSCRRRKGRHSPSACLAARANCTHCGRMLALPAVLCNGSGLPGVELLALHIAAVLMSFFCQNPSHWDSPRG